MMTNLFQLFYTQKKLNFKRKMKIRFFSLLILSASFVSAFAGQGVLYYKSGILDVAKVLLKQEFVSGNKAESSYYLGNIYFLENKKDSARYYFNEGLKSDPLFSLNAIGVIMLDMNSMDSKLVDEALQKIIKDKNNKKKIAVPVAASYAFLYTNNMAKATEYMEKARAINSKSSELFLLKGDILASTNLGDACSNYETAILYDSNCKEAYFKYAKVYKNMNPKQAIEKLMTLKKISPDFAIIDRELGDIYYTSNDFANAAKYYELYLNFGNTTNISDLTKYSMTLFLNHEFAKSLEVAQLGLKKSERNPAFNRLSMYNNVDLKNTEAALKAADLFFNKSDNPDFTYLDFRYYGQALKDAKKFDLAVKQYQKALEYDATKVELWKEISDMYSEIDSFANAISAYEKYMTLIPEKQSLTADVQLTLGKLYYSLGNDSITHVDVKKNALLKADTIFGKVAELEPDIYRANFWRARANAALDPETTAGLAKPYYEKTLAIVEPKNDPRYNAILIECYSYMGYYTLLQKDNAGSLIYWNKILVINPTNATANKAIAGIQAPKKKK